MTLRIFSFGGGVQSTAALVLAARREIDFPTFVFANVGADSEYPPTLRYAADYAAPYAERHGLTLLWVRRTTRSGAPAPTLYQHVITQRRSVPIPVYMNTSGAPGNRSCTADYKIRVVDQWLKAHGATKATPATVGLGISLDEFQRARSAEDPKNPSRRREYPLIALRLTRADCIRIIQDAGLPVPPKSSCWFCPFHRLPVWQELHDQHPALFEQAVAMERLINERRATLGHAPAWLTNRLIPLDQAIQGEQASMDMDTCESGYCHT